MGGLLNTGAAMIQVVRTEFLQGFTIWGLGTYQCYFRDSLLQLSYSIQQNPILTRLIHYRALEGFIGARVPFLVSVCEASVAGVWARACKVYRPSRGWGFRLQWNLGFKSAFTAATWYFVLQPQHWSNCLVQKITTLNV